MKIEVTYRLGDETGSQTFTKQKDALTFCKGLTERKAAMCGHTAKDLRALRTIGANLGGNYKDRKRVTSEKYRWYKTELPKHTAIPLQVQIKTVSDYQIKGDPTVKREYVEVPKHQYQNNHAGWLVYYQIDNKKYPIQAYKTEAEAKKAQKEYNIGRYSKAEIEFVSLTTDRIVNLTIRTAGTPHNS